MKDIPIALTIAGSEATGGAGMQADLKTFEEYGCHGMVALTSVVTMQTDTWAHQVEVLPLPLVRQQLATVTAGRLINAMKTGMLPGRDVIAAVRDNILEYGYDGVVIDPVMVCKGDGVPLNAESADALRDLLVPLATVATPNLFEAGVLSGLGALETVDDMKKAAEIIHGLGAKNVVVKGGRALQSHDAVDVLYDGHEHRVLSGPKIDNTYNQGAGCSFSAAICAGLAKGMPVADAVVLAKEYVAAAIRHGFAFNRFTGPVYHAALRLREGKSPG